jgi:hypothetical protein
VPKGEPILSAVAFGLGSSTPKRRPGYLRLSSCWRFDVGKNLGFGPRGIILNILDDPCSAIWLHNRTGA